MRPPSNALNGGAIACGVVSGRMHEQGLAADAATERRAAEIALGSLCGAGAALGWAAGLAAALHGIDAGLAPQDLVLHRYAWLGLLLVPFFVWRGPTRPAGISGGRAFGLTLFAGPMLALFSYSGFLLVPLGHGAVIQPSSAAIGGLLLTALFLHEPIARTRVVGALAIVGGLIIYGGESAATIGTSGIAGDLSFVAAGMSWAMFGLLLAMWRIEPVRAAAVVTALSFVLYVPVHAALFGFERLIAAGLQENLMQAVVQGVLAGAGGIYLFTRAVALLGPGRAAVFPALVPGFTMVIGYFLLGEVPSLAQFAGFAVVMIGFYLVLLR